MFLQFFTDWVPLLRSTPGAGQSVYELWTGSLAFNNNFDVFTAFDSCVPGIYKSPIVDTRWSDVVHVSFAFTFN